MSIDKALGAVMIGGGTDGAEFFLAVLEATELVARYDAIHEPSESGRECAIRAELFLKVQVEKVKEILDKAKAAAE